MTTPRANTPAHARRAFTLVELLVVITIIVLLIGILVPTGLFVLSNARKSSNQQLLQTISDGVYAFNQDFRYIPPLLSPQPGSPTLAYSPDHLLATNHTGATRSASARLTELSDRRWHSVTSLPVYLLGVGSLAPPAAQSTIAPTPGFLQEGGANYDDRHDGAAGPGIRDPGPDRSWGGAANRGAHRPTFQGRVYGPYIDPNIALANVRSARLTDFPFRNRINPPLTEDNIEEMDMLVFIDRFDTPTRYYKDWPERAPGFPTPPGQSPETLREAPAELISYDTMLPLLGTPTDLDRRLIDRELIGKPFALLSAGPDGRWGELPARRTSRLPLLKGADIGQLGMTGSGGIGDRPRILRAVKDNQRVTP